MLSLIPILLAHARRAWQDERMDRTPATLLEKLQRGSRDDSWPRFVRLFTPLLLHWCGRLGLQQSDASDLVQDVFTTLVKKLPEFRYDAGQSFRGWLRIILLNKWRDCKRRRTLPTAGTAEDLAHVPAEPENDLDEQEYRRFLLGRALELMQAEFAPRTWKACWEHVVVGRPAPAVAAELGIAVGSVYVAKSRVLCRLREELAGLLE